MDKVRLMNFNTYNILYAFFDIWHLPVLFLSAFAFMFDDLEGMPHWAGIPILFMSVAISVYWQFINKRMKYDTDKEELEHKRKMHMEELQQEQIKTARLLRQQDNGNNEPETDS